MGAVDLVAALVGTGTAATIVGALTSRARARAEIAGLHRRLDHLTRNPQPPPGW